MIRHGMALSMQISSVPCNMTFESKLITLLELFGFPGIKNLNQYYQSRKTENFEKIELINQVNKSEKLPYCPIILGVCLMDQIKKLETFQKS